MPDEKNPDPKKDDPKDDPKDAGGKLAGNSEPLVFDTWLGEQSDEVKTLLDTNTSGLKSALESERGSRKDLEGDIRDLAKKAEGDQKIALEGMADNLEKADHKTAFYESAHAAGVSNLKLAYYVANDDELFDRRGNVNFETMKTEYPELFGGKKGTVKSGAGDGNNNNREGAAFSMNEMIRKKAGRV